MSAEFICDACNRREKGSRFGGKPRDWYEREDIDIGVQHACSRDCIAKIAKQTGVTGLVVPR